MIFSAVLISIRLSACARFKSRHGIQDNRFKREVQQEVQQGHTLITLQGHTLINVTPLHTRGVHPITYQGSKADASREAGRQE